MPNGVIFYCKEQALFHFIVAVETDESIKWVFAWERKCS